MVKHTQTISRVLPTNCLSVFDDFVELVLKGSMKDFIFSPVLLELTHSCPNSHHTFYHKKFGSKRFCTTLRCLKNVINASLTWLRFGEKVLYKYLKQYKVGERFLRHCYGALEGIYTYV